MRRKINAFFVIVIMLCALIAIFLFVVNMFFGDKPETANLKITNFDFAVEQVKESLTNKMYYPYVRDISIRLDEEKNEIQLVAALVPAVKPLVALDYADALIRQTGFFISTYGAPKLGEEKVELKGASKDYYGELWDYYNCWVFVYPSNAPSDYAESRKVAYVEKYILKKMHKKQAPQLNKIYQ